MRVRGGTFQTGACKSQRLLKPACRRGGDGSERGASARHGTRGIRHAGFSGRWGRRQQALASEERRHAFGEAEIRAGRFRGRGEVGGEGVAHEPLRDSSASGIQRPLKRACRRSDRGSNVSAPGDIRSVGSARAELRRPGRVAPGGSAGNAFRNAVVPRTNGSRAGNDRWRSGRGGRRPNYDRTTTVLDYPIIWRMGWPWTLVRRRWMPLW